MTWGQMALATGVFLLAFGFLMFLCVRSSKP